MIATACKCGGRRVNGTCDRCGPKSRYDDRRSSTQRGYDRRWRNVRERVLVDQPLCVDCEAVGVTRAAVEVHHIVPIKRAPHLRLDRSNLVGLCRACHEAREAAGQ